ncbi:hypothetical protein HPB50_005735 [Hyalomma asiaticum]|uniref:Uncharacterized protein n=1 Tax=Hyalomma asiaticum TaxID=266040 RepID=A0ACB7SN87_HYAAI|nr:hypothetical protein HPB50_005735 [Hyalomma asiaticum]
MEETTKSSSTNSGIGRLASESERASTGDLASQRALSSTQPYADREWPVLDDSESATSARFTICCALATTLVVIVLFAITGTVWYRYVLLPSMQPEQTTQAREQQRKVLVVVVETTDAPHVPLAHSPRFGGDQPVTIGSNTTSSASSPRGPPNGAVITTDADCTRGRAVACTLVTGI